MAKRVLIAGFKHETNTFSIQRTDLAAYRARGLYHCEEMIPAFQGTNSEIAGFLDACSRHGWQPVLAVAADASPGGLVTRECFDAIAGHTLAAIDREGPVDAILLQLHGAMVAEGAPDGEGELLRRLRAKVGRGVPVGVTLDLHANVSDAMADLSDVIVSYRTYPHVDQHDTATACADLIARTLAGEIRPRCVVARGAMLEGLDQGRTTGPGPMLDILADAAALMRRPGVHSVSVNAGFSLADIADAGPSAVVVGEAVGAPLEALAQGLVKTMWETRHVNTVPYRTVRDAIAVARAKGRVGRPVVLADYADNPGGGGYSDSTGLLRGMIEAGLEDAALSAICDPESAAACHAAGEGARLLLRIGGKVAPISGPPVEAEGVVTALSDGRFRLEGPMMRGVPLDMGPTAAFKIGGVEVVLASRRNQNYDRMFFRTVGIEPAQRAVIAVKSMQHFRAAYAPLAAEVVIVDEGNGITSSNLKRLTYKHVRRPVFPLDLE